MLFSIPESAIEYGFRTKPGGAHVGKTMMLSDLRLLFAASPAHAGYIDLSRLVHEENVLLKATVSNRHEVFKRLSELYCLRQEFLIYRALRTLWLVGEQDRPLLAILCALARDTILRATAQPVLEQPMGTIVSPSLLASSIEAAFPDRYTPKTKLSISQNTAASWAQSGHLAGKTPKVRARATAGPAAAAYALLLGHLCGARGVFLFETEWARVLDTAPGELDSLAFAASQRGWIDYRRIGNVVEVGFANLVSAGENVWPV
jgi:hypothetical protein